MKIKNLTAILFVGFIATGCAPKIDIGVAAYKRGDNAAALAVFERNDSKPKAQYYLYEMYLSGAGVKKDENRAISYLRKAADGGEPEALKHLAEHLYKGDLAEIPRDAETAERLYLRAVETGGAEYYVDLAKFYGSDEGGKNKGREFTTLQKAHGTALGDHALTYAFEHGSNGASKDPKSAFSAASSLSQNTQPDRAHLAQYAKYNLAEYLFQGYGHEQDFATALRLLGELNDVEFSNPYSDAAGLRAWLVYHGLGMAADPQTAVKIWEGQMRTQMATKNGPFGDEPTPYGYFGLRRAYADKRGGPFDMSIAAFVQKDPATALVRNPGTILATIERLMHSSESCSQFDRFGLPPA